MQLEQGLLLSPCAPSRFNVRVPLEQPSKFEYDEHRGWIDAEPLDDVADELYVCVPLCHELSSWRRPPTGLPLMPAGFKRSIERHIDDPPVGSAQENAASARAFERSVLQRGSEEAALLSADVLADPGMRYRLDVLTECRPERRKRAAEAKFGILQTVAMHQWEQRQRSTAVFLRTAGERKFVGSFKQGEEAAAAAAAAAVAAAEAEAEAEGEEAEHALDRILSQRVRDGRIEYEVQWQAGDTTWEPLEHVEETDAFQSFLQTQFVAQLLPRVKFVRKAQPVPGATPAYSDAPPTLLPADTPSLLRDGKMAVRLGRVWPRAARHLGDPQECEVGDGQPIQMEIAELNSYGDACVPFGTAPTFWVNASQLHMERCMRLAARSSDISEADMLAEISVARMDRIRAELAAAGVDFRRHYYHPAEKIYLQCEVHKMKTWSQHMSVLLDRGADAVVIDVKKLYEVTVSLNLTLTLTRTLTLC